MTQPPLQVYRLATDPALGGGLQDPRTRTILPPKRILWTSADTDKGSVAGADILLAPKFGQVPEGVFLAGSGCRLENCGVPASLLLDFGRELHGGLRLAAGEPSARDVKVRVRFGESASEAMAELGERGAGNDHAIRDSVIDLPWLGVREIGNTGFRFVRLDLVSPGVLSLESVHAISLMRPLPWLGSFTCSDERLNAVWTTAARTLHLCCQEYIWDGIKRDRLVWAGDLHPEVMSFMAVFGPQAIVTESLDYLRDTTPADKWMNGMPPYTLWWIRCLHDWYHYTGDTAYLQRQHGYLKLVFSNLEKHIGPDDLWALPFGFLDWPTQHNQAAVSAGMQALMLMAFEDGARLAMALEDMELAARCEAASARLRQVRPDPAGSKQAAALLALAGLADPAAMNEQVLSREGARGVSTFYGYYMLEARALAGDVQGGIATVRDYWGGMLDMGATSFWEDFNLDWCTGSCRIDELPTKGQRDIHGDFGEFCYLGFRHSLCHGWASGPAAWLIKHVLGIQVADVGCRTMRVKPFLGDLDWAEGCFPTPLGDLHVRHEHAADGRVNSVVTAPEGMNVRKETVNTIEDLS
jgi:alpha-L-rhamnosidase